MLGVLLVTLELTSSYLKHGNSGPDEYLQNSAADYSVENQNRVAYSRIKELKDQGLNPDLLVL